MAARPRSLARRNWPSNLYARERNGKRYFFWRNPQTGQDYGLGTDFLKAKIEALEANLHLAAESSSRRLVDRLSTEGKGTVSDFLPIMRKDLEGRGLSANTIKSNEWKLRAIEAAVGGLVIERVTTKDLSDRLIEPRIAAGKKRSAVSILSMLTDMWNVAIRKGWTGRNPADALSVGNVEVLRGRLSLEQFRAIYAAAIGLGDNWIANMLKLAIVSAQPRECLCEWEFSDSHDGFVWNERGKTGAKIKLPLTLAVPVLGWTLDEAVKQCRDDTLSRYMLHHNRPRAYSKPGDQIFIDTLTKGFARARDAAGIASEKGKKPPSLHEVRSLSLRLYRDAYGTDFAQNLAGHKEASTTNIYTDVRGSEWIEVKLA